MFRKSQALSHSTETTRSTATILDVRTPEEFAQGHVSSARNIPVQELLQRHAELGTDKNAPIIVYCRSGARSATAARLLTELGFRQVTDIGAMSNWPRHNDR